MTRDLDSVMQGTLGVIRVEHETSVCAFVLNVYGIWTRWTVRIKSVYESFVLLG